METEHFGRSMAPRDFSNFIEIAGFMFSYLFGKILAQNPDLL
jgi:hypothetical protein